MGSADWIRTDLDGIECVGTFLTDIIGSWTVTVGFVCVSKLFLIDADEIVMVPLALEVGSRKESLFPADVAAHL